jgi:hypothetical protein
MLLFISRPTKEDKPKKENQEMNKYRTLGPDDVIQKGDEFQYSFFDKWDKWDRCTNSIGTTVKNSNLNLIRRPIKGEKLKKDFSNGWSFKTTENKIDLSRIVKEAAAEGHSYVIISTVGSNKKHVACKYSLSEGLNLNTSLSYMVGKNDMLINDNLIKGNLSSLFSNDEGWWVWVKVNDTGIQMIKDYIKSLNISKRVVVQVG